MLASTRKLCGGRMLPGPMRASAPTGLFLCAAVGGTPFLLSIIFYLLSNKNTPAPRGTGAEI